MEKDTSTNLITLAGMLQPVRESYCVSSIWQNKQIEPNHFNAPKPEIASCLPSNKNILNP